MLTNFAVPISVEIPIPLQPFVLGFIHGKSEGNISMDYPMFPNGYPLIINHVEGLPAIKVDGKSYRPSSNVVLAGQLYDADVAICYENSEFEAIGMILHPLAPYYLFHIEANKCLNEWLPIMALGMSGIPDYESRLSNSTDIKERCDIMLEFLRQCLASRKKTISWLETAITTILLSDGKVGITTLIQRSSVSERHFRRQFKKIVGMPPKYYAKVIQITSIFNMILKGNHDTLSQLAIDCGYYDQSHFIRDFKKIIGASPKEFLNSDYSFIVDYLGLQLK